MKGKIFAQTFPLRTTNEWLDEVRGAAKKNNSTMKDFIVEAVEEKVKKVNEKGEDENEG